MKTKLLSQLPSGDT